MRFEFLQVLPAGLKIIHRIRGLTGFHNVSYAIRERQAGKPCHRLNYTSISLNLRSKIHCRNMLIEAGNFAKEARDRANGIP